MNLRPSLRSIEVLLVTYIWLADVNASVGEMLVFLIPTDYLLDITALTNSQ